MIVKSKQVMREEVIRFYATYDRWKKTGEPPPSDIDAWPWSDPDGIDQKLKDNGLKHGALTAFRTWKFAEFGVVDLLECAVANNIFRGEPQVLSQLLLRGKLAKWFPDRATEWWQWIGNGFVLDAKSALILRRALKSEAPARWYLEDGSGRALALLQRIMRYGELARTAWAYVGLEADENSAFIKTHRELAA